MYSDKTKNKIKEYIQQVKEITANKLQYLGQPKKQIHNRILIKILYDLEKEGTIKMDEYVMNNKIYRVIKWNV